MSVLLTLTGGGDADPEQKCKMALLVIVRRKFRYLARIGVDSHRTQPTFLRVDDDAAFSAKSDGTKSRLSSRESPLISDRRLSVGSSSAWAENRWRERILIPRLFEFAAKMCVQQNVPFVFSRLGTTLPRLSVSKG